MQVSPSFIAAVSHSHLLLPTTDAPTITLQWASETMIRQAADCLKAVKADRRGARKNREVAWASTTPAPAAPRKKARTSQTVRQLFGQLQG